MEIKVNFYENNNVLTTTFKKEEKILENDQVQNLQNYQKKIDQGLETIDKTVVGAINEINRRKYNIINGTGTNSIQSISANVPKLNNTDAIYNPSSNKFDFSSVIDGTMNPYDGAIGEYTTGFGIGITVNGSCSFAAGSRLFVNADHAIGFGQGNYITASYSLINGGRHTVRDGNYIFVNGSHNIVTHSETNSTSVLGYNNNVSITKCSLISGRNNIVTHLYDGIVLGRYNFFDGVNSDSLGNILLGSYFNTDSLGHIVYNGEIGKQNIIIGAYHRAKTINNTTLIGSGLQCNNDGKVIIGNNNDIGDDLTNYSIVLANGEPGGTRSNIILFPKVGTSVPTKLKSDLDIANNKLIVKEIEISGKIDKVKSPHIENKVFKADESQNKMSIFNQLDVPNLIASVKAVFSGQLISSKYHGPVGANKAYSNKIYAVDGQLTICTDSTSPEANNKGVSVVDRNGIKIGEFVSSPIDTSTGLPHNSNIYTTIITKDSVTSPKFIGTANKAIADKDGNKIHETYVKHTDLIKSEQWEEFNIQEDYVVISQPAKTVKKVKIKQGNRFTPDGVIIYDIISDCEITLTNTDTISYGYMLLRNQANGDIDTYKIGCQYVHMEDSTYVDFDLYFFIPATIEVLTNI